VAATGHRLRKLNIVQLEVEDWVAAVQWYRDVIGLRVTAYEEDDQYCWMVAEEGDCRLGLYGRPNLSQNAERPRCMPSFLVDDLDSTLKHLAANGISPEADPFGEDEGFRSVVIPDPEGNRIEFYEWIAR
jgi:predicted enzyme related to lactoylglutathione lyase